MTELRHDTKILIVGLGLIGGCYAEALTAKGYSDIGCITKNEEDIDFALSKGIIKYGVTVPDEKIISDAELIIFALYPTIFLEWIKKYGKLISGDTLVTDVTGVKGSIVEKVQKELVQGAEFISAHPMAGREKIGVRNSTKDIFKGANYIVVPTEKNSTSAIEICKKLGEELGFATVSVLTVDEHDKMIAFLSQLTHCIAINLMMSNETPSLERFTGDSFRDLTRIAKINDEMWSELFLMNKDALLHEMDAFIDKFLCFRKMLADGDRNGMRLEMQRATKRRELFDKK